MGIGKTYLGNTGSVVYHDGSGNIKGATYASITTQGHLNLIDSNSVPSTPASGSITIFAEDYAGRVLPSAIGPSGVDYTIQSALYGNTTYMWLPGTGVTLAIAWGTSWNSRNVGTGAQSYPVKGATNSMTSLNRMNFSTGTTIASASGVQSTNTVAWMGNAAGLGGFLFFARFGLESLGTGATGSSYRAMVGLAANAVALAAEPSSLINSVMVGKDQLDVNWFVMTRNGTTGFNKINTGIAITAAQILDVYIHSAPNSQSVKVYIRNGDTGADLYVSPTPITTNLPVNTVFLYAQTLIQSLLIAQPKIISLNTMYVECDL